MAEEELVFTGRKKKRRACAVGEAPVQPAGVAADGDYSYQWLLGRAVSSGHAAPATEKAKFAVPDLAREGTKRTVWRNFAAFCRQAQRSAEHVSRFVGSELCSPCSPTPDGCLNIKARVNNGRLESICRQYITAYVFCLNCKGVDSMLDRDSASRLTFVSCHRCLATRSVPAVRDGLTRRPRSRSRASG